MLTGLACFVCAARVYYTRVCLFFLILSFFLCVLPSFPLRCRTCCAPYKKRACALILHNPKCTLVPRGLSPPCTYNIQSSAEICSVGDDFVSLLVRPIVILPFRAYCTPKSGFYRTPHPYSLPDPCEIHRSVFFSTLIVRKSCCKIVHPLLLDPTP